MPKIRTDPTMREHIYIKYLSSTMQLTPLCPLAGNLRFFFRLFISALIKIRIRKNELLTLLKLPEKRFFTSVKSFAFVSLGHKEILFRVLKKYHASLSFPRKSAG